MLRQDSTKTERSRKHFIGFGDHATSGYRRELNIERALHTVSYIKDGVVCRREYFASHPAGVMVFRFTADKPGALSGTITLADAYKGATTAVDNRLTIKGNLAGYVHSLSKDRKENENGHRMGRKGDPKWEIETANPTSPRLRRTGGREWTLIFNEFHILTASPY